MRQGRGGGEAGAGLGAEQGRGAGQGRGAEQGLGAEQGQQGGVKNLYFSPALWCCWPTDHTLVKLPPPPSH